MQRSQCIVIVLAGAISACGPAVPAAAQAKATESGTPAEILWDNWGVPHILAKDTNGAARPGLGVNAKPGQPAAPGNCQSLVVAGRNTLGKTSKGTSSRASWERMKFHAGGGHSRVRNSQRTSYDGWEALHSKDFRKNAGISSTDKGACGS